MQELRLVAVSEDGSYAVLTVPGRSGRFALPIDERLRTVARGQFSRLAQYEIEVESPLRPKEIQDRIRAGETAEDIADAAGLPIDRIRRFEGPVLAEREFRAQEAQRATVRGRGDSGPGPRLGDVVAERLVMAGAIPEDVEWDSRKRQDGNWQVQLAYTVAGRMQLAEWVFDPRSRHVTPDDDQAVRMSMPEADWPAERPGARGPVTATVTPIGSRTSPGGLHPADQRGESDRPAGRAIVHPSRQLPATAAAGSGAGGIGTGQPPGQGRKPGPAAEPGTTRNMPSTAEQAASGEAAREPAASRAASADREAAVSRAASADREAAVSRAASVGRDAVAAGPIAGRDAAVARAATGQVGGPRATGAEEARRDQPSDPPAQPEPPASAPAPAPAPAKRSGGRARRSSVPSWDEIMFGNSRQPD
jgi:hypothetical protein